MSIYASVLEMKKLLRNVEGWLDKAVALAATKKFEANTLLSARLAPDMFPLLRQVQSVCDQAKYAAFRTAGKQVPSHPDTEETIDQLRLRIASVVTALGEFSARDFDGTDDRQVTTPRWEGKTLTGTEYFVQHAQPNFYFHLMTVYTILRHNGVDVGKRDFLGDLPFKK